MKNPRVWTITLFDFEEPRMDAVFPWGVYSSEESMRNAQNELFDGCTWKLVYENGHDHAIWSRRDTLMIVHVHTIDD